jgi:integrase
MQLVRIKGTRFGVYKRTRANGDVVYVAKHFDQDGVFRQPTFKEAAKANRLVKEAFRNWGGRRADSQPAYSMTELIDEHMVERERRFATGLSYKQGGLAENTIIRDRSAASRIRDHWGAESARDLTRRAVESWCRSMLEEGCSESTVGGYAGVLRKAFRYAMRDDGPLRDLDSNPVPEISVVTRRPGQAFTAEQTWAIVDGIHPAYRAFAYTLAFSGMRIEEVCQLDVKDFDPEAHELRGGIKTDAGINRPIAIDPRVARLISEHIGDRTAGPLFLNTRGNRVNADAWRRRHWRPVVEALGIPTAQPHWNRHTAATLAAENGETIWDMMSHFGWADPRQANRYVHLARKGIRSIADTSMPPAPLRKVVQRGL